MIKRKSSAPASMKGVFLLLINLILASLCHRAFKLLTIANSALKGLLPKINKKSSRVKFKKVFLVCTNRKIRENNHFSSPVTKINFLGIEDKTLELKSK